MIVEKAVLTKAGWDVALMHMREEGADPTPRPGFVVVRVEACGVAHRDLIDRSGRIPYMALPVVPGHEASGRVVAAGEGVVGLAVGDHVATMHRDSCGACERCLDADETCCPNGLHVFGLLADGGYARTIHAPERAFYKVPDAMDPALAACLNSTYGTAYRALSRFDELRAGKSVLVTGANGGVGIAAIQIAKRMGASITAIVRSADKVDAVKEHGAEHVVVDDGRSFHKRLPAGPADVVLDLVGQPTFNASLRSARLGGSVAVVGNIVDAKVEVKLGFIVVNDIRICGSTGANRRDLAEVIALHERAPFSLVVADRVPLSCADEAQRRLRAGGVTGRIVIVPGMDD
jgi:acryloyl-coenzyme A reductase